jgi:hypothetical protein
MTVKVTRDGGVVRIALRVPWYARLAALLPLVGAFCFLRIMVLSLGDVMAGFATEREALPGQLFLLFFGLLLAYPGLLMLLGGKAIEVDRTRGAILRLRQIAFVKFTRRYKLSDLMRVAVEREASERDPFYEVRLEGHGLSLLVDSFATKLPAVELAKEIAAAIETPYHDLSKTELEDDGSPVVRAKKTRRSPAKAKRGRKGSGDIKDWAEGRPTWDSESGAVRFPLPASYFCWALAALFLSAAGIAFKILFESLGVLFHGHAFGLRQFVGLVLVLAIAAGLGALALLALSFRGYISVDKSRDVVERVRLFGFWRRSSQSKFSSYAKVSVWKEDSRSPRFGLGLAAGSAAPLVLARNYQTPDDAHDVAKKLAAAVGLPLETRVG